MAKDPFISVIFKLHNPSARRRRILDYVLTEYSNAMIPLLDWAKNNLEEIKANGKYRLIDKETGEVKLEKYTDKSIASVLPKASSINADIASCLKESLVRDVAANLASHLELDSGEKQEAGFPVSRDPSPEAWPNALVEFCEVGCDLEAEDEARARLQKLVKSNVMPVYYSRSRDFAILHDLGYNRFFLWLKLLAEDSGLAEKVHTKYGNLVDIRTGEQKIYEGKISLLFPIELGRKNGIWGWQYEKFIKPIWTGEAFIKSGRLCRRNGEYFFHVSVGFEAPAVYEPETYLGIDRGVLHSLAYGLVDKQGRIIEMGHSNDPFREIRIRAGKRVQHRQKRGLKITKEDYKQRELDGILHRLVNEVIQIALEHKAMIVLEDLNLKTRGRFYRSAYEKMFKFLEYKCKMQGVPIYQRKNQQGKLKPGVWAAYSSQLCIYCAYLNRGRKRDGSPFECPGCGSIYHSDEGAGVNIARRALYRAKDWGGGNGKPGDWRAFHRSFANAV